jgi:methyltransferase (TIGR00027 family)
MSITDPISHTARWTAALRARESRRPDRLFEDPFAEALAGPEGFAQMERMDAVSNLPGAKEGNPYLAIRTRFLDDFLSQAAHERGIRQIVLVAAGLDSRAFRLQWPQGTRLFELDRPEVLTAKQAILDRIRAEPRCERRIVAVDLATRWDDALVGAGFDRTLPSMWLAEGLLPYITEEAVRGVLKQSASLAAPESRIAADIINRGFLESPMTRRYRQTLEKEGAPWQYGTDDPEALFESHGWEPTVRQPGEPDLNYGRWRLPVLPRNTPGVPTGFLITAARRPS